LDGIALSINDIIVSMKEDTKIDLKSLKVDGGAVTNELLLEIQATISDINIIRPKIIETTAYGAALGAAVGHNIIEIENIKNLWKEDSTFRGNKDQRLFYEEKKKTWNNFIEKMYL
jgi:glycerol kinase